MAQTTIEQFASELKMPAGALLEQLAAAGVPAKKEGDNLTEVDKTRLLDYLRKQHGAAAEPKKRITLTRKQTTEIKAADSTGKARTIQVEVRKKRVLVRRDEEVAAPPVEEAPVVAEAAPVVVPEAPPAPGSGARRSGSRGTAAARRGTAGAEGHQGAHHRTQAVARGNRAARGRGTQGPGAAEAAVGRDQGKAGARIRAQDEEGA